MKLVTTAFTLLLCSVLGQVSFPQCVVSGRLGLEDGRARFGGILCFASLAGGGHEAVPFRTWETDPVGWYRISGAAGTYTLVFSEPALFVRPIIRTNVWLRPGDSLDWDLSPRFDVATFHESHWDGKRARRYFQPFVARGMSVTHVGFKLATDGVDGGGPGSQDLVVGMRKRGFGEPDSWDRVGPEQLVPGVDCGGPKSYAYSAGWCSGEVPTVPGETYALELRAADPAGTFQAFWRPRTDHGPGCFRIDAGGERGYQPFDLWLAIGSDSDGLVIPYQKRVHRKFADFAGFRSRWAQTWRARGRGLASVILYAAVGGAQPPLDRQRVSVRVREGGPDGKPVGVEKIGTGNGNYTGDASWGTFGAAFAPGEAPLVPGRIYAVEFESIETWETLHGFVNIKGQVSDDRPGFNPYRKCPPDECAEGTAYAGGTKPVDFDLDLQIIEYEAAGDGWDRAVEGPDLVQNGTVDSVGTDGVPAGWRSFAIEDGTVMEAPVEGPEGKNRVLRVSGPGVGAKPIEGGWVQRVVGLVRTETYRLSGRVRCTFPVDSERQCDVGWDPTGQTEDARAPTIVWTALPGVHGIFVPYLSDPIRPAKGSVSVWLHARSKAPPRWPFRADFDDIQLRRVPTGAPPIP